jgi:hypothetical protein
VATGIASGAHLNRSQRAMGSKEFEGFKEFKEFELFGSPGEEIL